MSYFQISVKGVMNGKTLQIGENENITFESTVKELRQAISVKTGLNEFILSYFSKQLSEERGDMFIKDFDIINGSTIFLTHRLKGGSSEIQEYDQQESNIKVKLVNNIEIEVKVPLEDTILQFKQKIEVLCKNLISEFMCLNYEGVKLVNEKKVGDYKINEKNVVIQSKADLSTIPGITISYEPDMISMDDSNEPRAQMSCGHVISSGSMVAYLQSLLDSRKYQIKCPDFNNDGQLCYTEWQYPDCRKVGLLTSEEQKKFEEGLQEIFMDENQDTKQCPICFCYIVRQNIDNQRVKCSNCTQNKQGYDFCWNCLKRWQSANPYGNLAPCGNRDCVPFEDVNRVIQNCGTKTIGKVEDIPQIRACPKCSLLIAHKEACKHMKCCGCQTEFCFICLNVKDANGWKCGECPIALRQQF